MRRRRNRRRVVVVARVFGLLSGVQLLAVVVGMSAGCSRQPPQLVDSEKITLSVGESKPVAGRRAVLWLGILDSEVSEYPDDTPGSAHFELSCGGERFADVAVVDRPTREICGVRVRLVELIHTTPPAAKLEITWKRESSP